MFCPECGTKIDEPMNFCPECGTNLIGLFAEMEAEAAANKPQETPSAPAAQPSALAAQPSAPAQQAQPNKIETVHADQPATGQEKPAAQQEEPEEELPEIVLRGFLFTNLTTLSEHLRTSVDALRELLQQFIKVKRSIGISYQLVDAGDYEYHEHGFFSGRKHVKLGKSSPWYEYADILLDMHKAEKKAKQPETDYLFILGGHETVPMPKLPHWDKNNPRGHDKDYDTDFLYAYPYGQEMEEHMWTGRIFTYDALFYLGRLPLVGGEEGQQDLVNYLNRDIQNSLGIPVEEAYAQADPNWMGVSTKVIIPLIQHLKFRDLPVEPPRGGLAYGLVILSPMITLVDSDPRFRPETYFNYDAQFVFINMHGGEPRSDYHYYGQKLHEKDGAFYPGIEPEYFAQLRHPNVVFAQPCYGGRFIGYSKSQSTVLTALSAQTLVFIGSSRSSWGNGDPDNGYTMEQLPDAHIGCSDITAIVFNDLVMKGCTVGEAFFQARCETYRQGNSGWRDALSIGEFNLFGDPTLFCVTKEGNKSASKISRAAITSEADGIFITGVEPVMSKSVDKPQSMLDQLRQQVNKNLMDMSDSIGKHLYEQYGIPKREPFFVQKVKYSNGKEELDFHYELSNNGSLKAEIVVQTSANGEIQNVSQSK